MRQLSIATTGVLIRGRHDGWEQKEEMGRRKQRGGMSPPAGERQPPDSGRGRAQAPLWSLEKEPARLTPGSSPVRPTLDFRPLDRSNTTPAVLSRRVRGVICYSSDENMILTQELRDPACGNKQGQRLPPSSLRAPGNRSSAQAVPRLQP